MKQKKTPLRKCAGCGEMKEKKALIRVVRAPLREGMEGPAEISLDHTGKKPGRGAYVCKNPDCLRLAQKARRLEKAFSCRIPDEIYETLRAEIEGPVPDEERGDSQNG